MFPSVPLSSSPSSPRMKEIWKLSETEIPGEFVGKQQRIPAFSEDEEEEELLLAGFSVEEETLMEVMKILEEEITNPGYANNGNTTANPLSSPFVTINGNEESCGPSFSDSSSTVMASVDIGSISSSYFMGPTNGFRWPEVREVSVSSISGGGINIECDCEVGDSEDEWLDRVLNGAPFEFDQEWSHDPPHSGF
ncbi:uncharacterized protein LOC122072072 [Macadamia integrifolia]|uniref:uncharacterized protein LOC122072072 n=1 Tax=Macadamia integrifolia TaxID=60698 RepID=UPI001C4EB54D|nr:uncharacterized protein LOC122072072 [Macadamia integrifolia]